MTRYLYAWLCLTIVLLAAVATLNLVVDPYGLFRIVEVAGLNQVKSQASERGTLFKRSGVERMRPRGLILGNSRAEIGLDPESPGWPASARPVFNLAIPGAGIAAVAHEFASALQSGTPKLAVVGLDFIDFRVNRSTDDRFNDKAPGLTRLQWIRDRASALLTMNALVDSLATIRAQRDVYSTRLTDAGFNPKRDYIGVARREGYFAMFRQRDQENAAAYTRGPKSIHQAGGRLAPGFDAVDSMIALAAAHRVSLRFVIYPYHAHTLALFGLTGLWPAYEDWKRELARRVDMARGKVDVELWDFSGFSPYADEAVPRPGDTRTELEWYWEAGHFKKSLGDVLLANMFNPHKDEERWGRMLTSDNVDDQLRRQRRAREDYERAHRDDYRDLEALVAAAAARL